MVNGLTVIDLLICDQQGNMIKHQLGVGKHTLGKSHRADIVLIDPYVSRHHADLIVTEDGVYLNDANSTNGTWYAEQQLLATQQLQPGDSFRLGRMKLEIHDSLYAFSVKAGRPYRQEELHLQYNTSAEPRRTNVYNLEHRRNKITPNRHYG